MSGKYESSDDDKADGSNSYYQAPGSRRYPRSNLSSAGGSATEVVDGGGLVAGDLAGGQQQQQEEEDDDMSAPPAVAQITPSFTAWRAESLALADSAAAAAADGVRAAGDDSTPTFTTPAAAGEASPRLVGRAGGLPPRSDSTGAQGAVNGGGYKAAGQPAPVPSQNTGPMSSGKAALLRQTSSMRQRTPSYADVATVISTMAKGAGPAGSSLRGMSPVRGGQHGSAEGTAADSSKMAREAASAMGRPFARVEALASSAVRVADKVGADLIIVLTHTITAALMVSKYRPAIPILTVVVPRLVSDGIHWRLEGKSLARRCLISRGLIPVLSAPDGFGAHGGGGSVEEGIFVAAQLGLVNPNSYVVCVERLQQDEYGVKVVQVNALGEVLRYLCAAGAQAGAGKGVNRRAGVLAGTCTQLQPTASAGVPGEEDSNHSGQPAGDSNHDYQAVQQLVEELAVPALRLASAQGHTGGILAQESGPPQPPDPNSSIAKLSAFVIPPSPVVGLASSGLPVAVSAPPTSGATSDSSNTGSTRNRVAWGDRVGYPLHQTLSMETDHIQNVLTSLAGGNMPGWGNGDDLAARQARYAPAGVVNGSGNGNGSAAAKDPKTTDDKVRAKDDGDDDDTADENDSSIAVLTSGSGAPSPNGRDADIPPMPAMSGPVDAGNAGQVVAHEEQLEPAVAHQHLSSLLADDTNGSELHDVLLQAEADDGHMEAGDVHQSAFADAHHCTAVSSGDLSTQPGGMSGSVLDSEASTGGKQSDLWMSVSDQGGQDAVAVHDQSSNMGEFSGLQQVKGNNDYTGEYPRGSTCNIA